MPLKMEIILIKRGRMVYRAEFWAWKWRYGGGADGVPPGGAHQLGVVGAIRMTDDVACC